MDDKFLKPYSPQDTEDDIYTLWEKSGFFNPDVCVEKGVCDKNAETFSIVLPPPNVTGTLHVGHAAMLALEDIMVRFQRMQGKRTLWLPGTDHAAIATESKVATLLAKKGIRRHELGREKFLKEVERFAQDSHDTIVHQIKKIGSSLDWSREAYTLDEDREKAVYTAFKEMYDDGLIYRGHRIVNWDPKGQTTISDDEVVYKEETTNFYYLKYGPFIIATARPETKFGDKYVVMHPGDKRYNKYEHGQQIELEWINGPITATIIKDEAIDMEFGTGVMTITPWHSQADFEIAERHNLEKEQIIDQYGKLLPIAGEFAGMKIRDAREKIAAKLKDKGLLDRIEENYSHNIATAERTGAFVEPQILEQWFVDVNKKIEKRGNKSLKELMHESVASGTIKILPERFAKVYFHWIENLRDWNISRQIWFGHRIPVWYRFKNKMESFREETIELSRIKIDEEGQLSGVSPYAFSDSTEKIEVYVGTKSPEGDGWEQDPDTLDTWFSSGLWTFSTLGWPEQTTDLATYHPTNVLETGYDILFFWVARMILMSTYLLGDVPFETVYLHGLVRDKQGRKMSKSLGNIVDPLDMIKDHGADALRMALVVGVGPGSDNNLSEDKIRAYSKFANKLWNIARFVLENTNNYDITNQPKLRPIDKKDLVKFEGFSKEVTKDIEAFNFHLASEKLYHYIWHEFADKKIEEAKKTNSTEKFFLLHFEFLILLKLLHPFMPFITEEIWQALPEKEEQLLMVARWPHKENS